MKHKRKLTKHTDVALTLLLAVSQRIKEIDTMVKSKDDLALWDLQPTLLNAKEEIEKSLSEIDAMIKLMK